MGTGTGEYSIQGVVDNILSNIEVIHTHVQENEDNAAAFFLAKHTDSDGKDLLQGSIVGGYGNAVTMLSAAMASDEDIAEYILDCAKHFLARSSSIKVGVIKVPIGSKIGEKLKDFFEQMSNEKNADNN